MILSFLFVDDIGNHNSAIGAVSRAWRGATELLAVAWNQDPHAIPMLAAPFVVMWTFGRKMRAVLEGTWSCTFPCDTVLPRCQIGKLLDPVGWLFDDTIVLFFCYVLHCAPQSVKPSRSSSVANWTNGGAPEVFS